MIGMAPSAIARDYWTCGMKREHGDRGVFRAGPRRWLGGTAFLRNLDGATAIEFAMIGVPFLGLLCAIFQTALIYFEAAQLQEATQIGSRAILTQSAAAGPGPGSRSSGARSLEEDGIGPGSSGIWLQYAGYGLAGSLRTDGVSSAVRLARATRLPAQVRVR